MTDAISNSSAADVSLDLTTSGSYISLADMQGVSVQNNTLTISGDATSEAKFSVSGDAKFNLFSTAATGKLSLNNITIKDAKSSSAGSAVINNGSLKTNNVTFSGSNSGANGGAIANFGSMVLTDTSFNANLATGNGGAIFNDTLGTADIIADKKDIFFMNNSAASGGAIYNDGVLKLLAKDGRKITINDNVAGGGALIINGAGYSGTVELGKTLSGYSGNVSMDGGTLKLAGQGYLDNVAVNFTNTPTLNYFSSATGDISVRSWTLSSNVHTMININPATGESDKFTGSPLGTGGILVSDINFMSSIGSQMNFTIADADAAPHVSLDRSYTVRGALYQYDAVYTDTGSGGVLSMNKSNKITPSAAYGQVATNAIAFSSAWRIYNAMAARVDKLSEVEAGQINLDGYETDNGRIWFSASGDFSEIKQSNINNIKSNSYSAIAGADTNGFYSAGGREFTSLFVGYLRTDSEFEGLKQSSDGVVGGVSEQWMFNGGFLGLTVVGGYSSVKSKGATDFSVFYAGGSLKGGYSFRFGDIFTLRPQAAASYTYASADKYKSNATDIKASTSHGVQVKPSLYLAFTLPYMWSVYAEAGYAYTQVWGGKISTSFENAKFSSIDPYAEGALGVEKMWANGIGAHLQVNAAVGGVTGFGADIGIKAKF